MGPPSSTAEGGPETAASAGVELRRTGGGSAHEACAAQVGGAGQGLFGDGVAEGSVRMVGGAVVLTYAEETVGGFASMMTVALT